MKCEQYGICPIDQFDQSENALINELRGLNKDVNGTTGPGQFNNIRQVTASYQGELQRIQSERLNIKVCENCPRRS
jgi:hypothetical protein